MYSFFLVWRQVGWNGNQTGIVQQTSTWKLVCVWNEFSQLCMLIHWTEKFPQQISKCLLKKSERPKTISKINKKSPSGLQNLQKWNKNRLEKLPRILVAYYLLGVSYHAVPLSKGNNRIWAPNKPYWFWYDVPQSLKLPLETEFPSEYFTEMLLSYIFRLIVVILSNNRCINLSIKTSEFTKMKQESTWKTRIFVAYCLLGVSYYAVLLSE